MKNAPIADDLPNGEEQEPLIAKLEPSFLQVVRILPFLLAMDGYLVYSMVNEGGALQSIQASQACAMLILCVPITIFFALYPKLTRGKFNAKLFAKELKVQRGKQAFTINLNEIAAVRREPYSQGEERTIYAYRVYGQHKQEIWLPALVGDKAFVGKLVAHAKARGLDISVS